MQDGDVAKPTDKGAVFYQEDTVALWDQDYYHPIAVNYYDKAIPGMLTDMGAQQGDTVLDAGCGPGVHSIRAAKFGCNMTAMDLSPTMLKHAAERAAEAGVADSIAFQQGDLTAPSLGKQFDFVFSWGVIIHIPDTVAALNGVTSLVAPKGKLALQILNSRAFDFRLEVLLRKMLGKPFEDRVDTDLGVGTWYTVSGERLWVIRFDMAALDKAMQARGFQLVSRRTAEFSEFQRRLPKVLRAPLLHLNALFYRLRAFTGRSATQIVIYERTG